MTNYLANTQIKVAGRKDEDGEEYIQPGDSVSKSNFSDKDWDDLVLAQAVVPEDLYRILRPELVLGANQPMGTPSNLAQITGTDLQMNPPDPDAEEKAPAPPPAVNPADVVPVDGAPSPGDGSDSAGQNHEEPSSDSSSTSKAAKKTTASKDASS
jgi:hypothetical protein